MKADGRRLGRIIGKLDDIEVLLTVYADGEYPLPVIVEHLDYASELLRRVRESVESAVSMINETTPRGE